MKKNVLITTLGILAALGFAYCIILQKERNTYRDLSIQHMQKADSLQAVIEKEYARAKSALQQAQAEFEAAAKDLD